MTTFKIKPKKGRFYFEVLVFDTKPEMWAYVKADKDRIGINQDSGKFGAMCISYEIVKFEDKI